MAGGNFGAWTEKACRKYLDKVAPLGYDLRGNTHRGWRVTDDYRPGMVWTGKTPAQALRAAGVWLPKTCNGYH